MQNPVIVALDVPSMGEALSLVRELASFVGAFKVGKELFVSAGPDIVRVIHDNGGEVFLDLKFHDIPHTVGRAVAAAAQLKVSMLTVHTAGGADMLRAAQEAAGEETLVLGVTVLTSMDGADLNSVGVSDEPPAQVERLGRLAVQSGLGGLVCSPKEIGLLRDVLPREVRLVTPGIRPSGSDVGDQKRTLTPPEAITAGADWLVIGRPITAAENPREAAEAILGDI